MVTKKEGKKVERKKNSMEKEKKQDKELKTDSIAKIKYLVSNFAVDWKIAKEIKKKDSSWRKNIWEH